MLSTPIAESSLTIDGVRTVVDGGFANAPRFDSASGMEKMRTLLISRSSAQQRTGRAGETTAPEHTYAHVDAKMRHLFGLLVCCRLLNCQAAL